MRATHNLPGNYRNAGTLDISKDNKLLVILNIAGLALMLAAGWLFIRVLIWLRPEDTIKKLVSVRIPASFELVVLILAIIALTIIYVILHEAVHGLCFWAFTRTKPHFAIRWTYAYAAAPEWFLPRNAYLLTALAPLVFISLAGTAALVWIPAEMLISTWFILTMNAAGSIGDILVAAWIARQKPNALVNDRGDAVNLFLPDLSWQHQQ